MTQQIRQICLHEESLNHSFRTATKLIPLPLYASQQTFGQQVSWVNVTWKYSSSQYISEEALVRSPQYNSFTFKDSWILASQIYLHSLHRSSLFRKCYFHCHFFSRQTESVCTVKGGDEEGHPVYQHS